MDLRDLRNVWEDLNVARLWEEHQATIAIGAAALAVLVLALNLTVCGGSRGSVRGVSGDRYFFDLNTGKLVTGSAQRVGPVDLGAGEFEFPDGRDGSAVEATVISCNDCEGVRPGMTPDELKAVDAKVGYLTRYPTAAHAVVAKRRAGEELTSDERGQLAGAQLLYADVEGKNWAPEYSPRAEQLTSEAFGGCGDQRIETCRP